ncbi:MAG: TPM domain-containing protein [Flavobacteriales bacterium]|nr:TPM domain-containing protein [Flavobacteriales bacterium]
MTETLRDFLSPEEEKKVVNAISRAEKNTSGEVRVHIEEGDGSLPPLVRAEKVFYLLEMEKTQLGNGVLLYIDVRHHTFAIWGGRGIYDVVPQNFWDQTYHTVADFFRKGKRCEGLCVAIEQVGEKLKYYFPYQSNDINELPDEISKGTI